MKKIRSLQILVYVVFGLLILQNSARDAYKGFMDGANWEYDRNGDRIKENKHLPYVYLDGSLFTHKTDTTVRIGSAYTLENINIISDIKVSQDIIKVPWWFDIIKILLVAFIVLLLFKMAKTVNKIIIMIYKGTTFNELCINHIRKTGMLMLMYSLADYAWQRLEYAEQTMLIRSPLKVVNTSAFNFEILLIAIFIFIIAEAFKQGGILKAEQELTI